MTVIMPAAWAARTPLWESSSARQSTGAAPHVIYETLLDAKKCSFLDINTILVNEQKRREILARVTNPDILD